MILTRAKLHSFQRLAKMKRLMRGKEQEMKR